MADTFTTERKIRFSHCDPAWIVYFVNFFDMVNAVVEDWFAEEVGFDFEWREFSLSGTYLNNNLQNFIDFVTVCNSNPACAAPFIAPISPDAPAGKSAKMEPIYEEVDKEAAKVTGLTGVPDAGEIFHAVEDEKVAKDVAQHRAHKQREAELAKHCMEDLDKYFLSKLDAGDVVVAGDDFGCGSSREHAAICPMHLGVKFVIAKSMERIHKANLCNFGILPLILKDAKDYDRFSKGSRVVLTGVRERIAKGEKEIHVEVDGYRVITLLDVSERQRKHLLAGGTLNFVKQELKSA